MVLGFSDVNGILSSVLELHAASFEFFGVIVRFSPPALLLYFIWVVVSDSLIALCSDSAGILLESGCLTLVLGASKASCNVVNSQLSATLHSL